MPPLISSPLRLKSNVIHERVQHRIDVGIVVLLFVKLLVLNALWLFGDLSVFCVDVTE
jgi:hypothetical protein